MIEPFAYDLRTAWRALLRAPAFSLAVVLTFALGMAGTTSMFALVEGILLRPLAIPEEERLVVGWRQLPNAGARHWPFHAADLQTIADNSRTLERVAGVGYNGPTPMALVEPGATTFAQVERVTGDFFSVLGAAPALGRALDAADDVTGSEPVLVVTHRLWQRLGGGRGVLGRRVRIAEQSFTVVGVMPPDVEHPRGVEAWATVAAMQALTSNETFQEAMRNELEFVARLRPGTTMAQALTELRAMAPALAAARADGTAPELLVPVLTPFKESLVGDVRSALAVLFGAVGLVLFIAAANAASLMLARGDTRRAEFAVRAALGGSRARLMRQTLIESALLALAAGAAGLMFGGVALRAWLRLVPGGLPRTDGIAIGWASIAFTVVLALLVAAAAGLAPAVLAVRADLVSRLRDGRGMTPAARRGTRLLIVVQVAVAVVVLAAAALLSRSLLKLQATGQLASDRLMLVQLALPQSKYQEPAQQARFMTRLVERLQTRRGVAAATPVNATPFSGLGWDAPTYTADGQTWENARGNPMLNIEEIYPDYFRTFDIAIVRGRAFTVADREGAGLVTIVSEDVAGRTWPGQDPIGKRLKMGDANSKEPWRTVVGVAARTRFRELREQRPSLYVPAAQFIGSARDVAIRTSAPIATVAAQVRAEVTALDADVGVLRIQPFAELLEVPLARPRFNALLVAVFAAASLTLLGIGLYAVIAGFVRQRRPEIGVRMALGATRADVHRLVLGEGLRLAGIGAALGLAGAAALTRVLRGLLFEIQPLDPVAFAAAAAVLALVALASLVLPARAASRVDPAATLRA
jgi:predicted permease